MAKNKKNNNKNFKPSYRKEKAYSNPRNNPKYTGRSDVCKEETTSKGKDVSMRGLRDGSSGINDPSFYNKMKGIFNPATSIQINGQIGITRQINTNVSNVEQIQASVPGIMVMRFAPVIGISNDNNDPLNALLTSSYAWYRTNYRAAAKYEPADIGLYNIGMASNLMMWAEIARVIGLVRLSEARNLYYPKVLVRAMGYNYTDLARNLSNLEERLNVYASQLRRWPIPSSLSVVERWIQLSSNVYKDSDAATAQTYVWQTTGYYTYVEGDKDISGNIIPGYLAFRTWHPEHTEFTMNTNNGEADIMYEDIDQLLTDLTSPYFGSSSMAQIASDTSSSVAIGGRYSIPDLNANFTIEPKYELEIQSQIENSLFAGVIEVGDINQAVSNPSQNQASFLVQQIDTNYRYSLGNMLCTLPYALASDKMLNFHNPHEISKDEVMVNTRFMPTATATVNATTGLPTFKFTGYGTEIATTFTIWTFCDANNDGTSHAVGIPMSSSWVIREISGDATNPGNSDDWARAFYYEFLSTQLLSNFDWHPLIYKYTSLAVDNNNFSQRSGVDMTLIGIEGDIDQYAIVDNKQLNSLHTAAVMSEMFIDEVTYYKPE